MIFIYFVIYLLPEDDDGIFLIYCSLLYQAFDRHTIGKRPQSTVTPTSL